ncbi:hypothetical protein [Streptomyces viridosporus]|uniref:hypothetical protein n=1 Tax=Streptomyces viridosporus TaxID=67581 RepID=UPI00135C45F7|nr:hypothetical protein [Streptomyces viridosporus]
MAPTGVPAGSTDGEGSHDKCAGPAPGVRVVPSSRIAAVPVPPEEEGVTECSAVYGEG